MLVFDAAYVHGAVIPQALLVLGGMSVASSQVMAWNDRPWRRLLGVSVAVALLGLAHQGIWLWVEAVPVYAPVFAVLLLTNALAMLCRSTVVRVVVLVAGGLLAPLCLGGTCTLRGGTPGFYRENHLRWWEPESGYHCQFPTAGRDRWPRPVGGVTASGG